MKKVFLVIFVFCARVVFSQTPEQIQRSQQQLIDAEFRSQELERAITKPMAQQPQQQEETIPLKDHRTVLKSTALNLMGTQNFPFAKSTNLQNLFLINA